MKRYYRIDAYVSVDLGGSDDPPDNDDIAMKMQQEFASDGVELTSLEVTEVIDGDMPEEGA
jgi:hypothetical protein